MEIKKLQDHILEQQQVIAKYYGETLVQKKEIEELKAENKLLRKQKNKWRELAESYVN